MVKEGLANCKGLREQNLIHLRVTQSVIHRHQRILCQLSLKAKTSQNQPTNKGPCGQIDSLRQTDGQKDRGGRCVNISITNCMHYKLHSVPSKGRLPTNVTIFEQLIMCTKLMHDKPTVHDSYTTEGIYHNCK